MQLDQRQQAMLQQHLSDQHFYYLLMCLILNVWWKYINSYKLRQFKSTINKLILRTLTGRNDETLGLGDIQLSTIVFEHATVMIQSLWSINVIWR